ncbi:protein kinase domain protein [Penicillium alfredii]|uniref:Protein kinase domain protein n=1 Tax=Penicillium alfredii TaxID=1506179 RepID=A0A9W9FKK9_9EURO|nr:protein kinase domain protein [Penicillium alfredii]KAJ5101890.1 protein kinase domain protein [Penicillium alfredii]
MALVAYDFKRKTKDLVWNAEYISIDSAKETQACEALVRRGLLGPELALRFQPAWRRYLHALVKREKDSESGLEDLLALVPFDSLRCSDSTALPRIKDMLHVSVR